MFGALSTSSVFPGWGMTWDTEYGPFNRTCWLNNVVPRHRLAFESIGRGIGDVKHSRWWLAAGG